MHGHRTRACGQRDVFWAGLLRSWLLRLQGPRWGSAGGWWRPPPSQTENVFSEGGFALSHCLLHCSWAALCVRVHQVHTEGASFEVSFPQIPLKLGQFGTLVGLIAPCTCDSHRRTRMTSMDVLSSLLDLHGRGKAGHQDQPLQAGREG